MNNGDDVETVATPAATSRHLTGREAVKTHLVTLFGLCFCALAFWFELRRALGGNALSWAYVFEWPLLGAFALYMWWKILHPAASARQRVREAKPVAPEYQGMLAAWQEQQRHLEHVRHEESKDERRLSDFNGTSAASEAP